MSQTGPGKILACTSDIQGLMEIRRILEIHGHEITGHLLPSPDPEDLEQYQLLIIDAKGALEAALNFSRRLRPRLEETVLPILFVLDDHSPGTRLATFEAGASSILLRPFNPGELVAQTSALLHIKDVHDRLSEKTAEVHRINRRLQQIHQQIDQELQLAQRIQESFLPQTLPEVSNVRFAVHYLLCGRVGGDFYDVFRLDEKHVGFYVADAMGHGVPASLLTIYVKKGVRAKEVFGKQYRLVPPDEVLSRLNRDLVEQELSERPFITMVYALFNHIDGVLHFSRAGHPYPLLIPKQGPATLLKSGGLLLGVMDSGFCSEVQTLAKGDKFLMYTDGVDNAKFKDHPVGLPSLIACAEQFRDLNARDFVARLALELFGAVPQPDDLTLLAVERFE